MDLPETGILNTLADPGESTLFETSLKSRNPLKKFKKSLMLTGDFIFFFSKNKNISAIDLQVTSYQGLHLSPCCFSWLQSDPKCYLGGKELRAVSGCSHSQTSAHPNSIPGVHCTSPPYSNTRGQQGRKPKVFLRHLHLVWIIREPFGRMGGIHTFFLGERQLGLHADIWEENTAGKKMFSSSLGLCLHLSCL